MYDQLDACLIDKYLNISIKISRDDYISFPASAHILPSGLPAPLNSLTDNLGIWGKQRAGDCCTVRAYCFIVVVPIFSCGEGLRRVQRGPEEHTLVFTPRANIPPIGAEGGFDLAGEVGVALVLADQAEIAQVVEPDSRVIAGDQDLIFSRHWFNSCDFTTP